MVKRALPLALARHAQAVKAAHAHLSRTMPGFKSKPPAAQFRACQQHVKQQKAR